MFKRIVVLLVAVLATSESVLTELWTKDFISHALSECRPPRDPSCISRELSHDFVVFTSECVSCLTSADASADTCLGICHRTHSVKEMAVPKKNTKQHPCSCSHLRSVDIRHMDPDDFSRCQRDSPKLGVDVNSMFILETFIALVVVCAIGLATAVGSVNRCWIIIGSSLLIAIVAFAVFQNCSPAFVYRIRCTMSQEDLADFISSHSPASGSSPIEFVDQERTTDCWGRSYSKSLWWPSCAELVAKLSGHHHK